MKSYRFELILGIVLAVLFGALWAWLEPGARDRLSAAEVDTYIRELDGRLPVSAGEAREFLTRLRAWGLADDGRPVYMLNVMSYYAQLRRVPGAESIQATPVAANAIYEDEVMPKLLRLGGFPLFGGDRVGIPTAPRRHGDLVGVDGSVDDSDRILVVRYPNRRAFFRLVSDPDYLKVAPYKFAALELALVPLQADVIVPDPRWIVGGLCLVVFCGAGWLRASRRGSG